MPIPSRRNLIAFVALALVLAQAAVAATPDQKTTTFPAKKFSPKHKAIDPANMDVSVKPGQDFYRYANGKWLEKNPIPPSESRWGSFSELACRANSVISDHRPVWTRSRGVSHEPPTQATLGSAR